MRPHFLIYIMAVMIMLGSLSHANNLPLYDKRCEVVISDIVLPFLDALKNGDLDSIKHYIAGDIYENKRVLLEKNEEYSEFLKNYYHGVEFYIEKAVESGNYIVVHVLIEFSNGDEGNARLYLGKDVNKVPGALEGATWKIIEFRYK